MGAREADFAFDSPGFWTLQVKGVSACQVAFVSPLADGSGNADGKKRWWNRTHQCSDILHTDAACLARLGLYA